MRIISYRIGACIITALVLSTVVHSEETRNYWSECNAAGKKSQADFIAYVDGLSIQDILILGKQVGEECQRKLQNVPPDGRNRIEDGYIATLGLVIGRFLERAEVPDKHLIFAEPIADSKSPPVWRKALTLMALELQDDDPEVVRWKDYALVHILDEIVKSPREELELRRTSCRVAGLILQWEYKKPPKIDKDKQMLFQTIAENLKICKELINDTNAPPSLIHMAEDTLKRYKETGISEAGVIGDTSWQTINQTAVGVQQIRGSGKTNDLGTTGRPGK